MEYERKVKVEKYSFNEQRVTAQMVDSLGDNNVGWQAGRKHALRDTWTLFEAECTSNQAGMNKRYGISVVDSAAMGGKSTGKMTEEPHNCPSLFVVRVSAPASRSGPV